MQRWTDYCASQRCGGAGGQVRAESRCEAAWASAQLAGATVELEDFDAPFAEDERDGCALRP